MLKLKINKKVINNKSGQNMVEYMILFVVVVLTVFIALGPNAWLTGKIDDSLNISVGMIDNMAVDMWTTTP